LTFKGRKKRWCAFSKKKFGPRNIRGGGPKVEGKKAGFAARGITPRFPNRSRKKKVLIRFRKKNLAAFERKGPKQHFFHKEGLETWGRGGSGGWVGRL